MTSSPGCWAAYGEILAREYGEPALSDVHRLSVDAYAAQHPGEPSPQSTRSVEFHLVRLCLTLEKGFDVRASNRIMAALLRVEDRFGWLEPPVSFARLDVSHVRFSAGVDAHRTAVREWSRAVWEAWEPHHGRVRRRIRTLEQS